MRKTRKTIYSTAVGLVAMFMLTGCFAGKQGGVTSQRDFTSFYGTNPIKVSLSDHSHPQTVRDAEIFCIEEENKRREALELTKVVAVDPYAREGSNDVGRAVESMITSYMARATRGAALQIMALGGAITQLARNARMRDKAEAVARIKGCKSKILSHRYAPNTAYVR